MRMPAVLTGIVGLAAGSVAAVSAYHSTAAVDPQPEASSLRAPAVAGRPLPMPPPRIVVTKAGCKPPARLEHGACVTHVVRTVVVTDPAPAAAPAPQAPAPRASTGRPAVAQAQAERESETEHEDSEHEDSQDDEALEPGDD